jgi:hypothetical protein
MDSSRAYLLVVLLLAGFAAVGLMALVDAFWRRHQGYDPDRPLKERREGPPERRQFDRGSKDRRRAAAG